MPHYRLQFTASHGNDSVMLPSRTCADDLLDAVTKGGRAVSPVSTSEEDPAGISSCSRANDNELRNKKTNFDATASTWMPLHPHI